MKILHISDTHGFHKQLVDMPEADVIVHSGDFSMGGSEDEVLDFFQWFCDLPYKHKIAVAGNHDMCLYDAGIDGQPDDVHYLREEGIVIDGIKFWGVPLFMEYAMYDKYPVVVANIPKDVDVLITHQPPYNILDSTCGVHFGSTELSDRLKVIKPKLHLFGHDHNSYGMIKIDKTIYSNGAIVDNHYKIKYSPRIIEI